MIKPRVVTNVATMRPHMLFEVYYFKTSIFSRKYQTKPHTLVDVNSKPKENNPFSIDFMIAEPRSVTTE